MKICVGWPILGLLGATFLALLVGCSDGGPSLGDVSGTVLIDGQPVADAEVVFEPKEGSPSYGMTDSQGRYRLMYLPDEPGAVVGEHTVRISTGRRAGGSDEATYTPERIPTSYNSESDVRREVKSGDNSFDFDIPAID